MNTPPLAPSASTQSSLTWSRIAPLLLRKTLQPTPQAPPQAATSGIEEKAAEKVTADAALALKAPAMNAISTGVNHAAPVLSALDANSYQALVAQQRSEPCARRSPLAALKAALQARHTCLPTAPSRAGFFNIPATQCLFADSPIDIHLASQQRLLHHFTACGALAQQPCHDETWVKVLSSQCVSLGLHTFLADCHKHTDQRNAANEAYRALLLHDILQVIYYEGRRHDRLGRIASLKK